MKNKKKKGNSILMVLAVTFIFATIGGVVVTSIMTTGRLNGNSKINDDLVYAAESGLESVLSELYGRPIEEIIKYSYNLPIQLTSTIEKVKIDIEPKIKEDGEKVIRVESTAYAQNGKKTKKVSCEIEDRSETIQNNGRNIFEYSMLASAKNGKIIAEGNSSLNMEIAVVNANGGVFNNNDENASSSVVMPTEENIDSNHYLDLVMNKNLKKIDKAIVSSNPQKDIITGIKDSKTGYGAVDIKEYIDGNIGTMPEVKSGIAKFSISPYLIDGVLGHPITVIIVNADILEIETGTEMINTNCIIICNGDIKMVGNSSVNLSSSTIYGKNIYINDRASMNVSYPIDSSYVGTVDFEVLNKKIGKVIKNWDEINGENAGSNGGSITPDYGFIDDSFDYE